MYFQYSCNVFLPLNYEDLPDKFRRSATPHGAYANLGNEKVLSGTAEFLSSLTGL